MNKTAGIVLGLVVVFAIGAGALFVFSDGDEGSDTNQTADNSQESSEAAPAEDGNTEQATAENAVSYNSDEGFEPSEITISAGDTVTWTNEGDGGMWVASNVHPQHTEFSEFDALKSSDSYSFTFDKAGEYGYHDHLNSGNLGTVIVK